MLEALYASSRTLEFPTRRRIRIFEFPHNPLKQILITFTG